MKIRTVQYYLREGFRSMIKNRLMSIASILTVASCVFIVAVSIIVASNVASFLGQIEENVRSMGAIVDDSVDAEGLAVLWERIQGIPHVANVDFQSRDAGMDWAIELFGEDSSILDHIRRDPMTFRRSFIVNLTDLRYTETVYTALDNLRPYGIADITHNPTMAEIALTLSNITQIVSVVLIFLLSGISVVIITNTIRITVNARRNEINIMKFVGATDWFIRWPFLVEGMLVGLVGSFTSAMISWLGYGGAVDRISSIPVLDFLVFLSRGQIFGYIFPFAIFLGIIIGLSGSYISIRRHLNV